ncbi:MAG: hypothetical protein KBT35_02120 [Firmicutes bacterium]|nr:hypothetical protein [Candidatus Colivicinus equi]
MSQAIKNKRKATTILLIALLLGCSFQSDEENNQDEQESININIELSEDGECIYDPGNDYGYRYGPSMIINDDGSIDAWFSRPGNNYDMWDYISYRHMDEDGDWGEEEIVLRPTEGSLDGHSVCDPGVFYYDGYYYLGYTSTINNEGLQNQIFVARSTEPNGEYEKWNGSGWGGCPQPIITYDGTYWGAGEISFVIEGQEVLCYYSWKDEGEDSMRSSKAILSENWPVDIKFRCITSSKEQYQCSNDVVYLEDYDVYLAFSIGNRMSSDSYLLVMYSLDGREFEILDEIADSFESNAHNLGISKHKDGHITLDDDLYISYAYSANNT